LSVGKFLAEQYDLSESSRNSYRHCVECFNKCLAELELDGKFEQVYQDKEVVHQVLGLMQKRLKPSAWNTYLVRLKRYAKWLFDSEDEEYPRAWRKVKRQRIDWEKKLKG